MQNNMERVRELLDRTELLCQLAEECMELGKAALKLRRVQTGTNPTPITEAEAWGNLTEEVADVLLLLKILKIPTDDSVVEEIQRYKSGRWVGRLEKRGTV